MAVRSGKPFVAKNYLGILKFVDYLEMRFRYKPPKIMPPDPGDRKILLNKRHDNITGISSLPG
jgi:hypothetical protein